MASPPVKPSAKPASAPESAPASVSDGMPTSIPASRLRRALASDFVYDFTRAPIAIIAGLVVLFLFLVAILAPLVAPTNPFDPASLNLMNGFTPPLQPNMFTGETFVMGTDDQERDLLSAIIYGLRVSLFVGVTAVNVVCMLATAKLRLSPIRLLEIMLIYLCRECKKPPPLRVTAFG